MKKLKLFSYLILLIYSSIMFYYAIVPLNIPVTLEFDSRRLLWHFLEHFFFGVFLLNAVRNTSKSLKFGLFYSILVEVIQLWAPTRVFDLYDLGANILGLFSSLYLSSKVRVPVQ